DLLALTPQQAYQVQNGFVRAISTGHITHECMFENNTTGERITEQEFIGGWISGQIEPDMFNMCVTKAELVEQSLVTIGSNETALALENALQSYFTNHFSPIFMNMKANKNTASAVCALKKDSPAQAV